jgi:predicted O-methyltransferase YrrM
MYSAIQLAFRYAHYYLTAHNSKGHGMHSPFVFDYITKVMNDDKQYYSYTSAEHLRKQLLNDTTLLTLTDYGAGSRIHAEKQRTVQQIAKSSLKPTKLAQLLFRTVNYFQPATSIELGTSLGVTTAYLAQGNVLGHCYTLEGADAVASLAGKNLHALGVHNVTQIVGNFDDTLPVLLQQLNKVDFAYVDGNHRYEPTIRYFEQLLQKSHEHTVLVFDDIHWSKEMEAAWHYIQQHQEVTLTVDLFFIGLVFLRNENKVRQHFTVRY